MKYAFIVLIAIYLVTYGCSPDESEKAPASHETTAPAVLEKSPQSEKTAAPAHQQEPATDQHEPAAVQPEPAKDQHEPAAIQQEPAQPAHEHQKAAEQAPATQAAEAEQVVMPCGRTMAKADVPENAPCLQMQEQNVLNVPDNGQELSAAMQKMVETSNSVMMATRQLVAATHEMLSAGKGGEAKQDTEQPAAGPEPGVTPEKEVVETMQQFISAAREVIDATNRAIYSVVEEK